MKVLYLDCISGVAGDMVLGALVGAGVPLQVVDDVVGRLNIPGWELHESVTTRGGITATRIEVRTSDPSPRAYREIRAAIEDATLPGRIAERSLKTFGFLAKAEAEVHGMPVEEVHFHEVGALDAIVDIVGAAAAFTFLEPQQIVCSPIPTGRGFVKAEHGRLPIPAPAVMEILRSTSAVLFEKGDRELITPTGAAILAAWVDEFGPLPPLTIDAVGYGAGAADTEDANVLRAVIGESVTPHREPTHMLIETNLDDMSPELIPNVIETLLLAGADDAWTTSVLMKKGRHAFVLSVLCHSGRVDAIVDTIFRETTTLGLRTSVVSKEELEREWIEVSVAGATVRVKIGRRGGSVTIASPEYEDARRAARASGIPLKDVYAKATRLAHDRLATYR